MHLFENFKINLKIAVKFDILCFHQIKKFFNIYFFLRIYQKALYFVINFGFCKIR